MADEPERRGPEPPAVQRLVRAARAGEARAFRELVKMFMRPVYAVGFRMLGNHDDADDVAQETFVRAYQALDRYDERYSLYTWLRTIASRLALNELEKRKRRQTQGGERFEVVAETHAHSAAGPDADLEGREIAERLGSALAGLPEEFRLPLVLRTYEDLSYAEIAATLEIPVGTVMSRIHRARCMLRAALESPGAGRRREVER